MQNWKGHCRILVCLVFSLLKSTPALAELQYVPSRPLTGIVVVLHGCLQSAESMALGTDMNSAADRNGWLVLYPQVPVGSNPVNCWNWYDSKNQSTASGQLKEIADLVLRTQRQYKLKHKPVFITGISSGGGTAAGAISCYPSLFKAAAIHSGPVYGSAQNPSDGTLALKNGPPMPLPQRPCQPDKTSTSILVIQGLQDKVVHPDHGLRMMIDFGSAFKTVPNRENAKLISISSDSNRMVWKQGTQSLELVENDKLGHAWAIKKDDPLKGHLPFFAVSSIASTELIEAFFKEHSR
ncbi:MAG: prolyl oligopeptidase family serine peptidase [Bdellovibrionales bacterium]|nr:prolyl oligopeptidase family serine peptidase [Bdellovibrionales bacterium]